MALEKFVDLALFPAVFRSDYPLNSFPLNINPQISQITIKLFSPATINFGTDTMNKKLHFLENI